MRVADLDELYKVMKEELDEMAIGDEFKSGFLYAMGIVKRERGIKIPKVKPDNDGFSISVVPAVVPFVESEEQE